MNSGVMMYELFSSREREKIMIFLLDNPSKSHRVREVAKLLGVSVGGVSNYFSRLTKAGIVKRKKNVFILNAENPLTRSVKIVMNISRLTVAPLKKIPGIEGIGLYGSWASGTNNENSDIDVWIKTKKRVSEEMIAKVSAALNRKMKRNVQLIVIDPEKNKLLAKNDPIFYHSLVFGSLVLYGRSIED
jgi:predicted nucleotidyltransferase